MRAGYTQIVHFPGILRSIRSETMVNVSKAGEVYRCDICGNVVVVKEVGGGELVCCGEPMQLVGE